MSDLVLSALLTKVRAFAQVMPEAKRDAFATAVNDLVSYTTYSSEQAGKALEWIEQRVVAAHTPGYGPNPCTGVVLVARALSETSPVRPT